VDTSSSLTHPNRDDDIIEQILTAVTQKENCDKLDLPPIYEATDPDALATIVEGDGVQEITFTYYGYHIQIDGEGRVSVACE